MEREQSLHPDDGTPEHEELVTAAKDDKGCFLE